MIDWLVAIAEGGILGVALYLCVRARMKLAPLVLSMYGQWGRRLVWILSILLMVVLANLGLVLLRTSLFGLVAHTPSLAAEACFAITGLVTGCLLVISHMRSSDSNSNDSNC